LQHESSASCIVKQGLQFDALPMALKLDRHLFFTIDPHLYATLSGDAQQKQDVQHCCEPLILNNHNLFTSCSLGTTQRSLTSIKNNDGFCTSSLYTSSLFTNSLCTGSFSPNQPYPESTQTNDMADYQVSISNTNVPRSPRAHLHSVGGSVGHQKLQHKRMELQYCEMD
jgi:hypothetical protein